jgi:hypothetical protein
MSLEEIKIRKKSEISYRINVLRSSPINFLNNKYHVDQILIMNIISHITLDISHLAPLIDINNDVVYLNDNDVNLLLKSVIKRIDILTIKQAELFKQVDAMTNEDDINNINVEEMITMEIE